MLGTARDVPTLCLVSNLQVYTPRIRITTTNPMARIVSRVPREEPERPVETYVADLPISPVCAGSATKDGGGGTVPGGGPPALPGGCFSTPARGTTSSFTKWGRNFPLRSREHCFRLYLFQHRPGSFWAGSANRVDEIEIRWPSGAT